MVFHLNKKPLPQIKALLRLQMKKPIVLKLTCKDHNDRASEILNITFDACNDPLIEAFFSFNFVMKIYVQHAWGKLCPVS